MTDLRTAKVALFAELTPGNFNEAGYLAANPDVAAAVRNGSIKSGRAHFDAFGHKEARRLRLPNSIADVQKKKLARIEPLMRLDLPHSRRGVKYDFVTEELRQQTAVVDSPVVSSNDYDGYAEAIIQECNDGLVLDCGAGLRHVYYANVVNFEIADYETTDVIGVGECLPFKDGAFDAVISSAVLEHVRDPFTCAAEIVRVLKPGGKLFCCVPFLQPLHGYPHHYYNMTGQGLRALFDRRLEIDDHLVIDSIAPIHSLTWIVQSWAAGLSGPALKEFLALQLRDLLGPPAQLLDRPWVKNLPTEKRFELASATLLLAHKPASQALLDAPPLNATRPADDPSTRHSVS